MNKELRIKKLQARIHTLTDRGVHNLRIVNKLRRKLRKLQPNN